MAIQAKYPGTCAAGGDPIRVGQAITRVDGRYSHATCAGPSDAQARRRFDEIDRTEGRNAANAYLDDLERHEARRQRERDNAEYAAGQEDARRYRENREMFGEAYAAAEEFARDMRGLNGDW